MSDKPYTAYNRDDCWQHAITLLGQIKELREKFAELEEDNPFAASQAAEFTTQSIQVTLAEAQVWATLSCKNPT